MKTVLSDAEKVLKDSKDQTEIDAAAKALNDAVTALVQRGNTDALKALIDEYKELKEEPKEIYISSAWYKSHWMWDYMKLVTRDMLGKGKSVLIGMDYSIALKHEIKTRDFLVKERKKLDRVAWTIEYELSLIHI